MMLRPAPSPRHGARSAPPLLLVDDDPALAGLMAEAARLAGFAPVVAAGADEFAAALAAKLPAMVMLDLGLPGEDGVLLLRRLADVGFVGPVLIISGFDHRVLDSAMRLGASLGLDMVPPLAKPVRLAAVEALLAPIAARLAE